MRCCSKKPLLATLPLLDHSCDVRGCVFRGNVVKLPSSLLKNVELTEKIIDVDFDLVKKKNLKKIRKQFKLPRVEKFQSRKSHSVKGTEEAIPEVANRQPSSLYFIESKQNETISVCCLGLTVMPVGIASRCLIWPEPYTCQLTRHPSTSLHVKLATCRPALPHPSPFQIRESVGRPTMEAAQEIDELPFFMCELAHRPIRHVGGFSKFTFIYNCQSVRELHEAFPNHFPGIEARDILFCTKKTPQILSNNIIKEKLPPIYTVVFAHVRGPEKEVKLVKTRRKLGLKILNHFGEKNFIVKIDHENLGFHASPMLQVGDFIRAINGVSMEGKSNVEVQRAFWKLPFGKEVEIRIVSPKRGTLLSYAPRKCCWNL